MARQVLENGVILPAEYSDDWYDDMTSNLTKLDDVIGSDSEKLSSADVGAAALSNNYNDLDNLPTIPTVNDATLTIQKNGVDVQTFTANASSNVTANITVPTKTSDLTNDSNFVDTSNPAVASGITSAKVTDYDTHIADTDIHVTTADKTKWNNQTYVFRYSSTALTPSSTNANSLLDNTDNLKVGDKVIDSSGVLFSVTAIDTQNSTFTIGTALIDLAQDSDVVHKSGDETISGVKTFSNNISTRKIISNVAQLQINARSNADSVAIIAGADASEGGGIWLYGKNSANKSHIALQVYDTNNSTFHAVRLNMDGALTPTVSNNGLGSRSFKWVGFNGINPGALCMPDLNNGIDISSYITLNADSSYTPISNGYVYICCYSSAACGLWVRDANNNGVSTRSIGSVPTYNNLVSICIPVVKNVSISIFTPGCENILTAKFYPCLGNV